MALVARTDCFASVDVWDVRRLDGSDIISDCFAFTLTKIAVTLWKAALGEPSQ